MIILNSIHAINLLELKETVKNRSLTDLATPGSHTGLILLSQPACVNTDPRWPTCSSFTNPTRTMKTHHVERASSVYLNKRWMIHLIDLKISLVTLQTLYDVIMHRVINKGTPSPPTPTTNKCKEHCREC